jgi:hypothetical protein
MTATNLGEREGGLVIELSDVETQLADLSKHDDPRSPDRATCVTGASILAEIAALWRQRRTRDPRRLPARRQIECPVRSGKLLVGVEGQQHMCRSAPVGASLKSQPTASGPFNSGRAPRGALRGVRARFGTRPTTRACRA